MALTGDYPLALGLTWELAQAPAVALTGTATIGGDLEALQVEHDLTGVAQAELRALVQGVLDRPRWAGEVRIRGVDLPAIRADLPALDLSGILTTSGDLDDARVRGNLVGAVPDLPDLGRLRAGLDVSWRDQVLHISVLGLTSDQSGALLTAGGELDLSDPAGKVDLRAAWKGLRWPLVGEPVAESRQGALQARGTFEAFGYRVSSEVRGRDFPAAKLRLTGKGNREVAQIEDLRIDTLDGKIEAKGRVAWSPEPSWALTLVANGLDPRVQWPQLPARIGLALISKGNLDAFGYELAVGIKSEVLPAATLELNGQGNHAGTRIRDLRLDTLGGSLRATANMTWAPTVTWDTELRVADMDPGRQWPSGAAF